MLISNSFLGMAKIFISYSNLSIGNPLVSDAWSRHGKILAVGDLCAVDSDSRVEIPV